MQRADLERDVGALRAIARHHCPSGAADDALQDTFLALLTRPVKTRPRSLRAWLIAVLLNFCRLAHRRGRRFVDVVTDEAVSLPLEELVDGRRAARAAVARLSSLDAEIVMHRDVAGASTAEVARQLGLTPLAVRLRLHRAHRRLRTRLLKG